MYYTIKETRNALKKGDVTSEKLVNDSLNTFESDKSAPIPLNAFIEMFDDAVAKAQEADKQIQTAITNGTIDTLFDEKPLLGLPFAITDKMNYKGQRVICVSKNIE